MLMGLRYLNNILYRQTCHVICRVDHDALREITKCYIPPPTPSGHYNVFTHECKIASALFRYRDRFVLFNAQTMLRAQRTQSTAHFA